MELPVPRKIKLSFCVRILIILTNMSMHLTMDSFIHSVYNKNKQHLNQNKIKAQQFNAHNNSSSF